MKNKALFLDRDGVVNYNYGYIYQIQKFIFKENIFNDIKKFISQNFKIIIITNQAGIAKNKFSLESYLKLQKFIERKFKKNKIDVKFFYCPHHKKAKIKKYKKDCFNRKPKPGMILRAAKLYSIDLKKSILIGDKISDIIAGKRAGINKNYLVKNIRLKKNKTIKRYHNIKEIYDLNFK